MKNVRIIFKDANPRDPTTVMPTVSINAEIAEKECGCFVELDYEPSPEEVCDAVQYLLERLLDEEERMSHETESH